MFKAKLVRNKIPNIIKESGREAVTSVLTDEEYLENLKLKLDEEVLEIKTAQDRDNLLEELADVLEVVKAISEASNSNLEEIESIREKKENERGGFDAKIYLENIIE